MLLSIIIPVYKTERFLAGCLDSICRQSASLHDVEVWVVDDGSPDDSISIIRQFERNYPTLIRVIRKANGGVSEARNAGLDRATGEFVWFVDSDDSVEPDCLGEILPMLRKTEADFLTFEAVEVDARGQSIGRFKNYYPERFPCRIPFSAANMRQYFGKHMVWMRLYRRALIGELRFPVGITHEDIHFDLQLLMREPLIEFNSQSWYRHYFDNPDSITNTMSTEKYRQVLWVYKDLDRRFGTSYPDDTRYTEFLALAVTDLLARARYMLSGKALAGERERLFREYAVEIETLLRKWPGESGLPDSESFADRLILERIDRGKFHAAYWAALASKNAKIIYDELGRLTYSFRHRVRNRQ